MLTIPETLSLHRATRARYMDAARKARDDVKLEKLVMSGLAYNKLGGEVTARACVRSYNRRAFAKGAARCFIRHARAANRKLIQVKRLERYIL